MDLSPEVLTPAGALALVLWASSTLLALGPTARRLQQQPLAGPALALIFMAVLWQLPVPNLPGLPLHLLGVTAAALICGPATAYVQVSVLAIALGLPSDFGWPATALYCLAGGGLPALVTTGLLTLARRRLPGNVFLFIFFNACLASAVGMVVYLGARELLLLEGASLKRAIELSLLLPLPEAVLTGTLIAPLVAFRSDLVRCFDADHHYGTGIR